MSLYFKSLSGEVKERYLAKIRLIGNVDPYDCGTSLFTRDLDSIPNISYGDIYQYLVICKSAYSNEEFKAYKSLEAFKFQQCGWVRDIMVKKFGENTLVQGKALHSQRMNEKCLQPWIIAKADGQILCCHCDCTAGLGETCSHVGAVLFAIEDAKAHQEEVSVTGVKAAWKVPRGAVGEQTLWEENVRRKKQAMKTYECPEVTDEQYTHLLQTGKKLGIVMAAHMVIEPHCYDHGEPAFGKYSQNPLISLYREDYRSLSLEELQVISLTLNLVVTPTDCEYVEKRTRKQSDNKYWHLERVGRITASNFKKACSSSIDTPAISTIRTICYPKSFNTKQTDYGCRHEKDALEAYCKMTMKTSRQPQLVWFCPRNGHILEHRPMQLSLVLAVDMAASK